MKRIAILHYAGPPVVGGVEITIAHHARLLVGAGLAVRVIAGRVAAFHPRVEVDHIPEAGSRHPETLAVGRELAEGQVSDRFSELRERLLKRLQGALADVDLLMVHNVATLHKNLALSAALYQLAEAGQLPMIAWCHDFAWDDELYTPDLHDGYPWDLLREPWPGVRYVTVSRHRQIRLAAILGLPPGSIQVVYPGVAVESNLKLEAETLRLVEKLNLLAADPLLLLPARLTRRKNIELAIRVLAALRQVKPGATLVVTGPPGPHNPSNLAYLDALTRLCKELEVVDRVHFLYQFGRDRQPFQVSDGMMSDFYRLADALLFPSLREGFGIPILEAGLTRMPIFAADIPSIRESAGELACLFDPRGDPGEIALVISARLDSDPAYRLRRRVLQRFHWPAILEKQLMPLIEEMIDDREVKQQT